MLPLSNMKYAHLLIFVVQWKPMASFPKMLKSMRPIPSAKRTEIAYSISVMTTQRLRSMISKGPIYECTSIFLIVSWHLLFFVVLLYLHWWFLSFEGIHWTDSIFYHHTFRPRRLMTHTDSQPGLLASPQPTITLSKSLRMTFLQLLLFLPVLCGFQKVVRLTLDDHYRWPLDIPLQAWLHACASKWGHITQPFCRLNFYLFCFWNLPCTHYSPAVSQYP